MAEHGQELDIGLRIDQGAAVQALNEGAQILDNAAATIDSPPAEAPGEFITIEAGGTKLNVPANAPPEAIKKIIESHFASPEFDAAIDKETGAPARVRMIVGGAPGQDKLANLQRFYPDARPHGGDNFVFVDPATGMPTLFNPEGLDFGDVAGFGREISQAVGSGLGATAGIPGGPLSVAIGAGAGNVAGGSLFDTAMTMTGGIDTRGPVRTLTDAAMEFGSGAVGQRGGELLGAGVKRAVLGGKASAAALVDAFNALRITPTAGAVSGSRAVATVEKALDSSPITAGRMQESAKRVLEATKAAAERVAAKFGRAQTDQGAGAVIRTAAKRVAARFGFKQEEIYGKAFALIGADTPVPVNALKVLREQMEDELAAAPRSLAGVLEGALARIRSIEFDALEGLGFESFRQIRTALGRDLATPMLTGSSGAGNAALKRIYGALTEDMSAVAREAGPAAAKTLAVADRFTRLFMNTAAKTMNKIDGLNSDEAAFKFALSASRDGGTGLARLRRHFEPAEWDVVAATVLGRLGKANPGAQDAAGEGFSVSTFLTNWNRLAPEAKTALFGGKRYKDIVPELDKLVKVIGSLKEVEKLTNTSNTARNLIAWGTMTTLGAPLGGMLTGDLASGGMSSLAGTVVVPFVAARLITSARFVKWLTTPLTSANGIAAHLGRLAGIASAEPELREDIGAYLEALRSVAGEIIPADFVAN